MELKHTPGPWHYEKRCIGSFLVGADGNIIAGGDPSEGYMDGSNPDERLIAAAPELLEALKELKNIVDEMGDLPDALICPKIWRRLNCEHVVTKAKKVIKKATGQQP